MRDEDRHICPKNQQFQISMTVNSLGIHEQRRIIDKNGHFTKQHCQTEYTNLFATAPVASSGNPLPSGSFRIGTRVHEVQV